MKNILLNSSGRTGLPEIQPTRYQSSGKEREEIYANDYRDLEHLIESVEKFIEHYYNRCRLHSALGYRPPEELEEEAGQRHAETRLAASTMTFVGGRQ